jgi:hypothetical protein
MHVLAHIGRAGHGLDDAGCKVGGIGAGEPHAPDAVHRADGAQQVGEIVLAIVVTVDRLPEQRDFGGAAGRERRCLGDDIAQLPAAFGASRVGDDTESAAVVAAALYRDERGRPRFAHRGDVLVMLPCPELGVGDPLAARGEGDDLRQPAISIGTDHEVHPGHLIEERGAEPLRHASHYAEHVAGTLVALQLSHPADHPLLSVVADGAGIHQHDVGPRRLVGAHVPLAIEEPEEKLRIGHIHLAAVGLDVDAFGHGTAGDGEWERRREKATQGLTITPSVTMSARSL